MNTTLKGMWETNAKAWAARCVEHGAEIDRLNGALEKMRAALKPFAKHAEVYDCWGPERDSSPLQTEHVEGGEEFDFTLGDLRRARDAFNLKD